MKVRGAFFFLRCREVDGDTVAGESGGVVGMGGFQVTDFDPKVPVKVAREFRAAGTFFDPCFVRQWVVVTAGKVGAPAADRVVSNGR